MLDLHFHCLPGIDDGPGDWDEAVALCREAAAQGTTHIIATPHVVRDPWLNEDPAARSALVAELNRRLAGTPVVLPGCEYFFSADAVELWQAGITVGLGGSSHLLVEFSNAPIPKHADAVFHELLIAGVTPVIAHPERHPQLARDLGLLGAFVRKGALTQLTAASVTGTFGRSATSAAHAILDAGLAHFVASDAHSIARRPPELKAARDHVTKTLGAKAAEVLFEVNPDAILKG